MESNLKLRRTAAALCSAAIHEIVPGSDLLGGGATDTGFFYQFFYPKTLTTELRALLEERMRQILKEDRPLREMEMVAVSAKEMFIKAHHAAAVDALEEFNPKELVSVIKIGNFVDLADGPFLESVRGLGAFQITAVKPLGDGEYRIEGCAAESKDELKAQLRRLRRYQDENHLEIGRGIGFWDLSDGGIVWLRSGLEARRNLISFFKKELGGAAAEIFSHNQSRLNRFMEKKGRGSYWIVSESQSEPEGDSGLFEDCCQSEIQQITYPGSKDLTGLLFSHLQLIHKTLIILGFHPELCLRGRRLSEKGLKLLEQGFLELGIHPRFEPDEKSASRAQWMVKDGLGRIHLAAELEVGETLCIKLSVERILGLLLEQTLGSLPKWITNKID